MITGTSMSRLVKHKNICWNYLWFATVLPMCANYTELLQPCNLWAFTWIELLQHSWLSSFRDRFQVNHFCKKKNACCKKSFPSHKFWWKKCTVSICNNINTSTSKKKNPFSGDTIFSGKWGDTKQVIHSIQTDAQDSRKNALSCKARGANVGKTARSNA